MKKRFKPALKGLILAIFVLSASTSSGQVSKLIVVDQLVVDELNRISTSYPDGRLLLLPETGNPLSVIAGELKSQAYSEIHLFALTKPGSIVFDEITILAENINEFAADFADWKSSAPGNSAIIIHSGVLTSVPEGNIIVNRISEFTGKKVIVE